MFNKKADAGARWYILLLAVIGSLIFCMFHSVTSDITIPNVGEFPIALHISLEKNNDVHSIVDSIMKQISKQSLAELNGQEANENLDLRIRFDEIFEEKYSEFKKEKVEDFKLTFSDIDYKFSVEKENGVFFIFGKTDDKLVIPLKLAEKFGKKERQIGKIFVNPSFKIPI